MVDVGSLLKVVGFREITVYKDDIIIFYPSMLELMKHLQLMGESNSTYSM